MQRSSRRTRGVKLRGGKLHSEPLFIRSRETDFLDSRLLVSLDSTGIVLVHSLFNKLTTASPTNPSLHISVRSFPRAHYGKSSQVSSTQHLFPSPSPPLKMRIDSQTRNPDQQLLPSKAMGDSRLKKLHPRRQAKVKRNRYRSR